jgi:hypothetical protein
MISIDIHDPCGKKIVQNSGALFAGESRPKVFHLGFQSFELSKVRRSAAWPKDRLASI